MYTNSADKSSTILYMYEQPLHINLKTKQLEGYMYTNSADKSSTILYMYEQPLHINLKTKQLKGYTSIGSTKRVSSQRGGQNSPRGDTECINN